MWSARIVFICYVSPLILPESEILVEFILQINVQLLELRLNFRSSSWDTFRFVRSLVSHTRSFARYVFCGWLWSIVTKQHEKKKCRFTESEMWPNTKCINILQGQIGKSFNWTVWKRHGRWPIGMAGISFVCWENNRRKKQQQQQQHTLDFVKLPLWICTIEHSKWTHFLFSLLFCH